MVERLKRVPNILVVGLTAIIGFAIFITINLFIFGNLPENTYGILHYEFAWSVDKVLLIFANWGTEGMTAQAAGVWWDFPYIIGYSLFIGSCILLVTRMNGERIQNIGLYMTLTPFFAGLFDVVENIFLLIMLKNPTAIQTSFPIVATICASVKFVLLLMGIVYFAFALVTGIIHKIKNK